MSHSDPVRLEQDGCEVTGRNRLSLWLLGAAHVVTAVILLPATMYLSVFSVPVVTAGLVWLGYLGVRHRRPDGRLRLLLRRTHLVLAPVAILMIIHGFHALRAARRSAEGGGGLLGAVGIIPLVMGFTAAGLSMASLCVVYSVRFGDGD